MKTVIRRSGRVLDQLAEIEGQGELAPLTSVSMGIDPSLTKLGISLYGDGNHLSGIFKPKFSGVQRLHHLRSFIESFTSWANRRFELTGVTMEGYAFAAKAQHHKIGEGGGAIKLGLIDALGLDDPRAYPTIVPALTLKKFVTGKGKGDKNTMLLQVYKKWGVEFQRDDLADAYSLARLGALLCSGEDPTHKYEQEVANALERNTEWSPPTLS